jgi:hypothetical protein
MKPAGEQSPYKRKTLLRRRACKVDRRRSVQAADDKQKSERKDNQVLDRISLPQ